MSDIKINMYDPRRDNRNHKEEYDKAINEVIDSGLFINGPQIKELEKQLSEFTGSSNCICVSNGTDALKIALLALGVGHEDEVITVAHTWISSAEVIPLVGAKPVFVDIEDITFNIDPLKIEEKITEKTRAIIAVSLYGQTPDFDAILSIANKHSLPVIEDGAQSFGAVYNNKKSCNITHIGTTSFFPSKPLGCYGDGGACFTNDDDLATKMRAIKGHGGLERFKHKYIGMNARLDTIQAAILLVKLKYFEECLKSRNKVADYYNQRLGDLDVVLPKTLDGRYHAWAQYSILMKDKETRDYMVTKLKEKGVNVAIFYPAPLHTQECFQYLGYKDGDLPITENVCDRVINLPIYGELTIEELEHIVNSFRESMV